jgi:26S proteasome regulatory subunit (ATPase 3-interacting protein)
MEQSEVTLDALLPYRGDEEGRSKVDPLSEEEMKAIDDDFARWRKQWVDRRKVYKE